MPVIQTDNLTKSYGKSRGIIDLNLTVEQGEFFGFIGPNGSGKSTTIRTLLGLISPTSGSAEVLGIGGGLFAAYLGITVFSKEEKEHTAEFLLSHPVSRFSVAVQKLASVLVRIIAMNIAVAAISSAAVLAIGENFPAKEFMLIHTGYLILQLEIGAVCAGISAFIRRGSVGIGLGIAAALYFANIICNITENAEFIKYITPFAYSEPADIISSGKLNAVLILLGAAYAAAAATAGIIKYIRKDIAA